MLSWQRDCCSSAATRDVVKGYVHTGSAGLAQLVGPQPSWNAPATGRHRPEQGSVLLGDHGAPSLSCSMLALCMIQSSTCQPQE